MMPTRTTNIAPREMQRAKWSHGARKGRTALWRQGRWEHAGGDVQALYRRVKAADTEAAPATLWGRMVAFVQRAMGGR